MCVCECMSVHATHVLQICALLDASKAGELGLLPAQVQSESNESLLSLCVLVWRTLSHLSLLFLPECGTVPLMKLLKD